MSNLRDVILGIDVSGTELTDNVLLNTDMFVFAPLQAQTGLIVKTIGAACFILYPLFLSGNMAYVTKMYIDTENKFIVSEGKEILSYDASHESTDALDMLIRKTGNIVFDLGIYNISDYPIYKVKHLNVKAICGESDIGGVINLGEDPIYISKTIKYKLTYTLQEGFAKNVIADIVARLMNNLFFTQLSNPKESFPFAIIPDIQGLPDGFWKLFMHIVTYELTNRAVNVLNDYERDIQLLSKKVIIRKDYIYDDCPYLERVKL